MKDIRSFIYVFFTFFFFSISLSAQEKVRRNMFEKVHFTVQTRNLPKKVILSENKTVNFTYKTYGNSKLDTPKINLVGYEEVKENADLNIILYADKILNPKIEISSFKKKLFNLNLNYICPITFELINKNGEKIDGISLNESKSWQTIRTWTCEQLFDNEKDANNYYVENKEKIFQELSLKSLNETLPIFEDEINDLYGYKEGELQKGELLTLKKKKNSDLSFIDTINNNTIKAAEILGQINSDVDIVSVRDSLEFYISFLENEINPNRGPFFLLKQQNLATIYLFTEQYDKAIEKAKLLRNSKLSAYYISEAQTRKKSLERHGLNSFSFTVAK